MPNWCAGTLRVRGKISDLKRFVLDGLQPINLHGEDLESLQFSEEDEQSFWLETGGNTLWMRGTHRHFCETDCIGAYADDGETPTTMLLPMKAAWAINAYSLLSLCRQFNVDMRVQGFERGMEFSQLIEIIDGEITHDVKIKYDDWVWDCPCPLLGG